MEEEKSSMISFHIKQYMTTKPPLQEILKGILHTEDKNIHNHERTGNIKPQQMNRQVLRVA
jgi:hypothetical protein